MIKKLEFVAKPWLLDKLDHKLTKPHTEGFYSGTQFKDVSYRKSKHIILGKFVKISSKNLQNYLQRYHCMKSKFQS